LLAADLRDFEKVIPKLKDILNVGYLTLLFMDSAPTLFLAECFFVYLEKSHVHSILTLIQSHFELASCIVCDHLNTDPRFGSVMIRNLAVSGVGIYSNSDKALFYLDWNIVLRFQIMKRDF
jgi:O-methyltransferase involved in polyketide biosynthesis